MLDLHIPGAIGGIPLDAFAYRDIMLWVQSLISEGAAPKTIHNVHGLLSAAMTTAEMLGYIPRNRCRGVRLPTIEHVEDNTRFLTHAEFCLVLNGMDDQYNSFISFLVMTGTRFGEATAITVADVDLISRPPTARINKAWKRDGHSQYYLGATKTGAGKRTIGLRPALVELLIPLVAGRAGTDLLFTTHAGNRIAEKPFWEHYWRPAVHVAHTQGLTKSPPHPRPTAHPRIVADPRRQSFNVHQPPTAWPRLHPNHRKHLWASHAAGSPRRRRRYRAPRQRLPLQAVISWIP
jgi:integrase